MKIKFGQLALISALAGGCANFPVREPAPPTESKSEAERVVAASGFFLCVVNNTPDLILEIVHDGESLKKNLRAGEYFTIRMKNDSEREVQSTVVVLAKNKNGSPLGVVNKTFAVSNLEPKSESWIVNPQELTPNGAKG